MNSSSARLRGLYFGLSLLSGCSPIDPRSADPAVWTELGETDRAVVFVTWRGYAESGLALRRVFLLINFKQTERVDGVGAHQSRIDGLQFDCNSADIKQFYVDYFRDVGGDSPLPWSGPNEYEAHPGEFVLPAAIKDKLRAELC